MVGWEPIRKVHGGASGRPASFSIGHGICVRARGATSCTRGAREEARSAPVELASGAEELAKARAEGRAWPVDSCQLREGGRSSRRAMTVRRSSPSEASARVRGASLPPVDVRTPLMSGKRARRGRRGDSARDAPRARSPPLDAISVRR